MNGSPNHDGADGLDSSAGERFFAFLLRGYPAAFRERFGGDFVVFFREHRRHPRFRGWTGAIRFWLHTMGDVFRTAITERHDSGRQSTAASGMPGGRGGRFSNIGLDIRYAVRSLLRDPIFTSVAVITLALGIGATTTVFTVVQGVLLTPLDHPEPDRLVRVYERERANPDALMVAYGNYVDLRDEDRRSSTACG